MKSILIIGMGRFGRNLGSKFIELGDEVMAVDKDEELINNILPSVTSAHICDCTREESLRVLGVKNFDICFVCIGSDFKNSLVITNMLKELGAKRVISKSGGDVHTKFLKSNGADQIIDPERESAESLAVRCSADNLFNFIELSEKVSIYEIPPAKSWIGKSIRELDFRARFQASILAVKSGGAVSPLPPAEYKFSEGEHLIIMSEHKDMEKILDMIK